MSFVGIGGVGYEIELSVDDLEYNEVWRFVLLVIVVVMFMDVWRNVLRKNVN